MAAIITARRPHSAAIPSAALLLLILGACTTTRFPENPEDHRLYDALEAAGHEYYFNVRAGVSSRVLGIQPEADAIAAIAQVRQWWPDIDRLDASPEITAYLNAHGLGVVADGIDETLLQNQGNSPPDGIDEGLEAAAVKQGLIDAAVEAETG